jgi:6-phosphofructokinase 2
MIATVTLNPSLDEWIELPRLRLGRLNRAEGFARYPGGKGINVSRVVRELGGRTRAFALAGGEDGHLLRLFMRRLDIPHTFIPLAGSTRNNYKIITRLPRAVTELNTAGPRAPASALRALERRLAAARPSCVALSGSLPPGAPAGIYASWIRRLAAARVPVALDSSGAAFKRGLAARPWMIKPNRQEAEELLGRRLRNLAACVDAVRALLRRGVPVVILSLGADGALMGSGAKGEVWLARAPRVRVRAAVGAGDSLVGGFLTEWQRSRSLPEAFRAGVASGTAAVMTPGTELCRREDVRRITRRVVIKRVAAG